jgi:predicted nucleic-acid-binding protein
MIAIDTNILARWILLDDEVQSPIADRILDEPCWLGWTVLLELAWLLSSYGKLTRDQIADVLDALLAMPTIHCDRPANVQWAIERYRDGADIADMIHIASSGEVAAFMSFEEKLARKAGPDTPVPVTLAQ